MVFPQRLPLKHIRTFIVVSCLGFSEHRGGGGGGGFVESFILHTGATNRYSRSNTQHHGSRSVGLSVTAAQLKMPETIVDLGCDPQLWQRFPPGAKKDINRFLRTGKHELAQNRVQSIQEILTYVLPSPETKTKQQNSITEDDEDDDAMMTTTTFDLDAWEKGVAAWEFFRKAERDHVLAQKKEAQLQKTLAIAAEMKAEKAAKEKQQQNIDDASDDGNTFQ